jgi:hypothetical protein
MHRGCLDVWQRSRNRPADRAQSQWRMLLQKLRECACYTETGRESASCGFCGWELCARCQQFYCECILPSHCLNGPEIHGLANIFKASPSSSSRTSSISPNASGFPATCPTDDRKTIRDNNGVAYQVLCASDVGAQNGGGESSPAATSSFNDCFALCDAAVVTGGAGRCTGFTYVGQVNGAGGGTCYLKSETSYTIGSAGTNFVGAIRHADAVSSSSSSVVLASTTASSVVVSSSSSVVLSSSSSVVPSSSSSVVLSSSSSVVLSSSSPVVLSSSSSVVLVSTTSSSSSAGVATPTPTNACFAFDDRDTQNFAGTSYMIACTAIIYPYAPFAQQPAPNNWNDCPVICNTLSGCTGFWYSGGVVGVGPGTCFFSNAASSGFVRSNNTQVAGRKYPQPPGYNDNVVVPVTTTTTTTTTSSIPIQTQTFTTVSYATITTTSSYPVTNTVVSTFVQTFTTSYPVTTTQVSTAPGEFHSDTACLA